MQAAKDALAQLEPDVDEIVVSTHGAERSGWMRRNVVEEIERLAGGIPVTHVTVERDSDEQTNVLVIANQTVLSSELLDRIRARAAQSKAAFLIVAPQADAEDSSAADRRLRLALTELLGEGINAHGQIVEPDPYTAAMNAVHDERIDEIIVSTFPNEKSGWLRRDLSPGSARTRDFPSSMSSRSRQPRRSRHDDVRRRARPRREHHGPPPIHYSSRVSPAVLGMFLFIASEIMLFGSFFTVYFFDRVVNNGGQRPVAAAAVTTGRHSSPASTR